VASARIPVSTSTPTPPRSPVSCPTRPPGTSPHSTATICSTNPSTADTAHDLVRDYATHHTQHLRVVGLTAGGRCTLDRGDTETAATQLRQAMEIYQRIGAAEATQLATDLADLQAE
jgi:hypothetical protein